MARVERLGSTARSTVRVKLEYKLEAELHHSRTPGAVDFSGAVVVIGYVSLAVRLRKRTAGPAERQRPVDVVVVGAAGVDPAPTHVIEGVERLRPELEGGMFTVEPRDREVFDDGQVGIVAARPRQLVATLVAEHPWLPIGEQLRGSEQGLDRRVVPCRCRSIATIVEGALLNLHLPNGVTLGPGAADPSTQSRRRCALEIDGRAREEGADAADRPAA